MRKRASTTRGVSLVDTLVGVALLIIVFAGVAAALELSLDVVANNKARAGAIALADQRIEYIRSLPYASIGTVNGVPSGTIAQSETVSLNNVTYTRRTYIAYEDDSSDGTGAGDSDGTLDYKAVKVDVSWISRTGQRDVVIATRISTPVDSTGKEINPCSSPCGTLQVNVTNAASQPVLNAQVQVVDPSASPAVNLTTFTNASGIANVIGAPAASGYQVLVTKSGYTSAQTYSASATNTNPTPANLTVTNSNTTSATFSIDLSGEKTIKTLNPITTAAWSDPLSDTSKIASSTDITVSGGAARVSDNATGEFRSIGIEPDSLYAWKTFNATSTTPAGTSIVYHFYDGTGQNLIPDTEIPGNAAGITASSVDLSLVSTTTYSEITVDATLLGNGSASPSIDAYGVTYSYGPTPFPNVSFTLQGSKVIGNGPPLIYKCSQTLQTNSAGVLDLPNFEWDTYTLSLTSPSYDISSACHPIAELITNPSVTTQFAFQPGTQTTSQIYLVPHTTNALLVEVRSAATGADIPNATVTLTGVGTVTADSCGQAFFSGLSATNYPYTVSASGYSGASGTAAVSGTSRLTISLN